VRIRLRSTVVGVRPQTSGDKSTAPVQVAYLRDGNIHVVRGKRCILACYNSLIPALVPDLPTKQKEALAYSVKVPMMYNTVLIRRWTAFQKLGASSISAPGMYHTSVGLDPGTKIGGYRGVTTPEEPILVHMVRNPNTPGLPRREQNVAGQQELLRTTFEQFELEIRRQLGRMLAGGGFDPAADIVGVTVNRWPILTSRPRRAHTWSAASGSGASRLRTPMPARGRSPTRPSTKRIARSRSYSRRRVWHDESRRVLCARADLGGRRSQSSDAA
jgi:spermidine dehydrogenase